MGNHKLVTNLKANILRKVIILLKIFANFNLQIIDLNASCYSLDHKVLIIMIQKKSVKGINLQPPPYDCIGRIILNDLSKSIFATGFLISPSLVLTAANFLLRGQKTISNVHHYTSFQLPKDNQVNTKTIKIRDIKIHPQIIQMRKKIASLRLRWGSQTKSIKKNQIEQEIKNICQQGMKFDFALLELENDIKRNRYFECWQDIQKLPNITVSGYFQHPQSKQLFYWTQKGEISEIKDGLAFYSIDTQQGQIGSPVYLEDRDNLILIGINQGFSEDNQSNYCVIITQELIDTLKSWTQREINIKKILPTHTKDTTNKRYPSSIQDEFNIVNRLKEKQKFLINDSEENIVQKTKLRQFSEFDSNQLQNQKLINQKNEEFNRLKKEMSGIIVQNNKLKSQLKDTQNMLKDTIERQNDKIQQYQSGLEHRLKHIESLKSQIINRNSIQQKLEKENQRKELIIKAQQNQIKQLRAIIQQNQKKKTQDSYKKYKKSKQNQQKLEQDNYKKIKQQIYEDDYNTKINKFYDKSIQLNKKESKNKDVQVSKSFDKSPINKIDQIYDKDSKTIKYQKNAPQIDKIQNKVQDKYIKDKYYQQNKYQLYKKQKNKYKSEYQYQNGKQEKEKQQNIMFKQSAKTNQLQKHKYRSQKLNQIKKQSNTLKRRQLKLQFASQSFQRGYTDISLEQFDDVCREIELINNKTFEDEDTLAYVYAFMSNLYTIKKDGRFREFANKAQIIYRKNPSMYFEEVITLKNNLAYAYQNTNDLNKAISIYNDVLQLQNQFYSINDERKLSTLNNIFCLYFQNGHQQESQNIFKQIRPILAKLNQNSEMYKICMRNCQRYQLQLKK